MLLEVKETDPVLQFAYLANNANPISRAESLALVFESGVKSFNFLKHFCFSHTYKLNNK